jgi:hypothetical protein
MISVPSAADYFMATSEMGIENVGGLPFKTLSCHGQKTAYFSIPFVLANKADLELV